MIYICDECQTVRDFPCILNIDRLAFTPDRCVISGVSLGAKWYAVNVDEICHGFRDGKY